MSDELMTITCEKFLEEYHTFYEMLCSTKYTVDEKREAYTNIMMLSTRVKTETPEEEEQVQMVLNLMAIEVPMRLFYEETSPRGEE